MFGKKPHVNPLESRKRLLIAESELNRVQMVGDMAALRTVIRTLTGRVKFFGSLASASALLVAGLAAFRRGRSMDTGAKPFWLRTLFKGAGVVSTLWPAFRANGHEQENK
jgi:hypothetical protein